MRSSVAFKVPFSHSSLKKKSLGESSIAILNFEKEILISVPLSSNDLVDIVSTSTKQYYCTADKKRRNMKKEFSIKLISDRHVWADGYRILSPRLTHYFIIILREQTTFRYKSSSIGTRTVLLTD